MPAWIWIPFILAFIIIPIMIAIVGIRPQMKYIRFAIINDKGVRKNAKTADDTTKAIASQAGAMADISSAIAPQTPTCPFLSLFSYCIALLSAI